MRKNLVLHLWGRALWAFSGCLLIPLLLTIYMNENRLAEFGVPILLSLVLGYKLTRGTNPYNGRLSVREGVVLIGGGILGLCFLGMLPFYLGGYSFVEALFESVSGFTTTGASVLGDLEFVPAELLLWRSLTQWLGGLGTVLVFITLVPQVGKNAMGLFLGELYGESAERMLPRMAEMVRALCYAYTAFTALIVLLLYLSGMTSFEALNHAMTMVSTGGFSIYNDGLTHFHSPVINLIALVTMFVAGGNYVLYFRAYKQGLQVLWQDSEYKAYAFLLALTSCLVAFNLWYGQVYELGHAIVTASFQVVSLGTTSGFAVADYNSWPDYSKLCLFLLMFIGGCSGSAAGGLKVSRLVVLLKSIWVELKRTLHPHMVTNITVSGINVQASLSGTIFRFFFLYILTFFVSATLLALAEEFTMLGAAGVAVSCLANIGSGFEIVTGLNGFAVLNTPARLIAIATMLLGRMEIFTLCLLFYPGFWEQGK